jgi:hypothetical protein
MDMVQTIIEIVMLGMLGGAILMAPVVAGVVITVFSAFGVVAPWINIARRREVLKLLVVSPVWLGIGYAAGRSVWWMLEFYTQNQYEVKFLVAGALVWVLIFFYGGLVSWEEDLG